jgi:hypothetical protein
LEAPLNPMTPERRFGLGSVWLAGTVGGLIGALVVGGVFYFVGPNKNPKSVNEAPGSGTYNTPVLAHADSLRCPRGLRQTIQVRGKEDGFDRNGDEPSRIEPSLLRFGSFQDAQNGASRALGMRAYDEGGADKQLIDYFAIPKGTLSGTLIVKLRAVSGGAENDYLKLTPSRSYRSQSGADSLASFSVSGAELADLQIAPSTTGVFAISLDKFVRRAGQSRPDEQAPVLAYLDNTQTEEEFVTLTISDDTAVDVAVLSLCVEPETIQGVTFAESSDKPLGPDVSVLGCAIDETQGFCGPYSGDTLCSKPLPVACFQDGTNPKPAGLREASINDAAFVGGQVRPSSPVAASKFKTRSEVDSFCAREFGEGFRVLSYQEGGGGMVISRSQIAPRTRLWIDIADQPRGRCWDRPPPGTLPKQGG